MDRSALADFGSLARLFYWRLARKRLLPAGLRGGVSPADILHRIERIERGARRGAAFEHHDAARGTEPCGKEEARHAATNDAEIGGEVFRLAGPEGPDGHE